MHVHIYKPCQSASQSGKAKTKLWCVDFDPKRPLVKSPKTGWVSSEDMLEEVSLFFETLEEAICFCKKRGYSYVVRPVPCQKNQLKSYGDHFRFDQTRF